MLLRYQNHLLSLADVQWVIFCESTVQMNIMDIELSSGYLEVEWKTSIIKFRFDLLRLQKSRGFILTNDITKWGEKVHLKTILGFTQYSSIFKLGYRYFQSHG